MLTLPEALVIYFKATDTCQLNCDHCFTNGSSGIKNTFDMEATKKFLSSISDTGRVKHLSFILHGGEPMLAPIRMLKEIVAEVNKLFDMPEVSISTNLTYPLTLEKLNFFQNELNSYVGTSWDYGIRWKNEKQEYLWERNVHHLRYMKVDVGVSVTLSKDLIEQVEPEELLGYFHELDVESLDFERITPDGHAVNHEVFPTNKQIDDWLIKAYRCFKESEEFKFRVANFEMLEGLIKDGGGGGTMCRDCEQKILTLCANGDIGGCPNTATNAPYAHISDSLETILNSEGRKCNIKHELHREEECYACPNFDVCTGDCHQLTWDSTGCPANKGLISTIKSEHRQISFIEV